MATFKAIVKARRKDGVKDGLTAANEAASAMMADSGMLSCVISDESAEFE